MLRVLFSFALALFLISHVRINALECYTGRSFVRGKSVGTETEVCKKPTDQCFKGSADGNAMVKIKLAGCSTIYGLDRCMVSRDKCTEQEIAGHRLKICCCNTDLCNIKQKKNLSDNVGGLMGQFGKLLNKGGNGNQQN